MSNYTTVRGKTVTMVLAGGHISLDVNLDGELRLLVARSGGPELCFVGDGGLPARLTEAEASTLYDLLGDVVEWESRGSTVNQDERQAEPQERAIESGEAEDLRAASNR